MKHGLIADHRLATIDGLTRYNARQNPARPLGALFSLGTAWSCWPDCPRRQHAGAITRCPSGWMYRRVDLDRLPAALG